MIDPRIRPVHTCYICDVIFGSYCKIWKKPICFGCRIKQKDPNWIYKKIDIENKKNED